MSQQVCLRWGNHRSNMVNVFGELLRDEAFVDVTLACEDLTLKAHKIVLSACSPFFQSIFSDNPGDHPVVILKDIWYSELRALIDFMYYGEVYVCREQLDKLLKSAEALKVKGLGNLLNSETVPGSQAKTPTIIKLDSVSSQDPKPSKRKRGRPRKRLVHSPSLSSTEHLVKFPSDDDMDDDKTPTSLHTASSSSFMEPSGTTGCSDSQRSNEDKITSLKEEGSSNLPGDLPIQDSIPQNGVGDSCSQSLKASSSQYQCRQLVLFNPHGDVQEECTTPSSSSYPNIIVPYTRTSCKNTVCYECGRNFSTRGSLRRHQLLHTPVRGKFHCPCCPKAFSWPGDLQTHIRCFHPDIPKSDRKYKLHFRLKALE